MAKDLRAGNKAGVAMTRREWARLSGVAASTAVIAEAAPAPVDAAAQTPDAAQTAAATAAAPVSGSGDSLLEERRASRARSSEELRKFALDYDDEPLFRLVVG